MRYYLRREQSAPIQGPLSTDEIQDLLNSGKVPTTAQVVAAVGQTSYQLKSATSWLTVTDVVGDTSASYASNNASGIDAKASELGQAGRASRVIKRYRDAYLIAQRITSVGACVKSIGIAAGIVILLGDLIIYGAPGGQLGTVPFATGLISGSFSGGLLYLIGVLISATGELNKAQLDSAVNTSPFLTDDQRAEAMYLG